MRDVSFSASAATRLGSCSYSHEPVRDGFGSNDGQGGEREVFDAEQGLVPFTGL